MGDRRDGRDHVRLGGLGLAYLKLGRLDDARRTVDRAIQHWSATSTAFSLAYATTAAALIWLAEGDLDAAVETARRAVAFAEQSRFRLEQGAAHRVLGQTLAATGNRGEADAALRRSLEILEDIRSLPELGQTLLAYGRFKADEDPSGGRRLLERARAIFAEIGATGWLAEAVAALEAP